MPVHGHALDGCRVVNIPKTILCNLAQVEKSRDKKDTNHWQNMPALCSRPGTQRLQHRASAGSTITDLSERPQQRPGSEILIEEEEDSQFTRHQETTKHLRR